MTETVYARSPDVVWRLGPDRVLVRRIGGHGEEAAAELLGEAALVWIALDEPAAAAAVADRIAPVVQGVGLDALEALAGAGWVAASNPGDCRQTWR